MEPVGQIRNKLNEILKNKNVKANKNKINYKNKDINQELLKSDY